MITIKIDGKDSLDRSLKKLKKKFENTKVVRELRKRKEFEKKSDKRRNEVKKAVFIRKKSTNEGRN